MAPKNLRIAFVTMEYVTENYFDGGLANYLHRTTTALARLGHHSYDPEKCLEAWMSCIRQGGLCLLEQTSWNGPGSASELDPFGADITLMPYLITMWAKGKYGVREIIDTPERQGEARYSKFIVIQKF